MSHLHTSSQPGIFDLGYSGYTCNWGAHICALYGSREERDEILYGYLHAGNLAPTEYNFAGVDEEDMDEFYQRFDELYPEDQKEIRNQLKFEMSSNRELYYSDGEFSPWKMEKKLSATYHNAKERGFLQARTVADMIWAKRNITGKENLMAYEARLNFFVTGKTWSSLCMYDTTRFSGAVILQVLQTHPFMINNGVVTENPFYTDPNLWLKENAPEFVSH